VNGLSTSLPQDVQMDMVRSIKGLETAELMRFGYAIEYDCMPPTQLKHSLETKLIENLFFAGQINCTSGYEEAAAQGLMAGLNAIRKLRSEPPFILDRSEAYIGVLIDDLVTRGTNEPYRLFTSRAEFRLLLRQDNADERLMKYGHEFGLISDEVYDGLLDRTKAVESAVQFLRSTKIKNVPSDQFLKRQNATIKTLIDNGLQFIEFNDELRRKVEWDIKYEGYIKRQLTDVNKFRKLEKRQIPEAVNYFEIPSLGREALEKLSRIRPISIGQASRIPGISSCDLSILLVYIDKLARVSRETQN
jgi:tRNA uridine 5-carboxymethylaminomethyl modification enzyme